MLDLGSAKTLLMPVKRGRIASGLLLYIAMAVTWRDTRPVHAMIRFNSWSDNRLDGTSLRIIVYVSVIVIVAAIIVFAWYGGGDE